MINLKENILLSEHTTIELGGRAKYFFECNSESELTDCINYSRKNNLKIQILGGGSNIVFSDEGFNGIVIKIGIKGISIQKELNDKVFIKAGAGEVWDEFARYCVKNNYAGVECLAGIPGSVGATPIQNVGAYGQEVKDTILSVKALNRITLKVTNFKNEDCLFDYRQSRFKNIDKNKYIVTEVTFGLTENGKPEIKYPELNEYIKSKNIRDITDLSVIMNSVIELRKKKSMVVDENDPNSISCGSFFVNPVINNEKYEQILKQNNKSDQSQTNPDIPFFKTENGIKIPAAWLIENTGFPKGFKRKGIGISEKHNLAIINCGGNTKDLLNFINEIRNKVFEKFNINLEPEPVIVEY